MHRKDADERVSFFFTATNWTGEPTNMEPDKCGDLSWFMLDLLPVNMVSYVKSAIHSVRQGEVYSEFGWLSQPNNGLELGRWESRPLKPNVGQKG